MRKKAGPARGAGINTPNRFLRNQSVISIPEAIDDWEIAAPKTIFLEEHAKTLVNKVTSPDVGMYYSMNPYQGCEHGCAYCYARNAHEYWSMSAGIDFEQKIVVKKNAPDLLRKFLMQPSWQCVPLSLSGNTDCYQPAEQKFRITRKLLEVCASFNQPVSIITKNAFVLKDKDLLTAMAAKRLAAVLVTITTFNEALRSTMEPRTTTALQRLRVIRELSAAGIPCGVMVGPVIPGLNDHELATISQQAAAAGATFAAYTFVRLNGSVQLIFHEWLHTHFPDKADKVWHLIEQGHDGKVNDSRFGLRMRGEGPLAAIINQQFKKFTALYGLNKKQVALDCSLFARPGQQLAMF